MYLKTQHETMFQLPWLELEFAVSAQKNRHLVGCMLSLSSNTEGKAALDRHVARGSEVLLAVLQGRRPQFSS